MRQVVPGAVTLNLRTLGSFSRLAVSKEFLAWGQWGKLVGWRSLIRRPSAEVRFDWKAIEHVVDVDLFGDRLLILGSTYEKPEEYENFSPDGAVAFLGSAREGSGQTLKPANAVESYEIPVPARSLRERLRVDYRYDRLVVLVTEERLRPPLESSAGRLVVLELPGRRPSIAREVDASAI